MSSIVDNLIFQSSISIERVAPCLEQDLVQRLSKMVQINEQSILLCKNSSIVSITKLKLRSQMFLAKFTAFKDNFSMRNIICLLQNLQYWRCLSKQNEILLMKQLVKRQKQCSAQSNIYINKGRIEMVMDHYLIVPESTSVRWVSAYHKIIVKNILHFEDFIHKYLKIGTKSKTVEYGSTQLQSSLVLSQILNTTQANIQISQEKSQYKFADRSFEKQNEQIASVYKNIVKCEILQKNVKQLFVNIPYFLQSLFLKQNFTTSYQNNSKTLKSLLLIKYPPKKRVEDYVYNMIKAQMIEGVSNGRPIGQGGTSLIYAYRMKIIFVGSTDCDNLQLNQQSIEKMVAVKKARTSQQGRRDKIIHEKRIVSKFRSSFSYFLPKYYEAYQPSQLNNCLLMEMISGEQLDFYVGIRSQTISFWNKIYLLVNVIHGMRHLSTYEIVHLDLKPINILVCKSLVTKIIDFGQAYHQDVCPKNYTPGFTFPYVAPQVYARFLKQSFGHQDSLQFSEKQDVFAFGIIMFEIIFNTQLLSLSNSRFKSVYANREMLQRIFIAAERNQSYGDETFISMIIFMIIRCIDPDPKKRPRIEWIGIGLKLMLNSFININ